MNLYDFDREWKADVLCGVDEAGRGPLAGPVVAAAVVFPSGSSFCLEGLNDSKKLTEKKREALYPCIVEHALTWAVGVSDVEEIERVNILQATFLAMQRAVKQLQPLPDMVLVDGPKDPGLCVPTRCIVKGDSKSASIAAASIIAKVTRDHMMQRLDEQYPQYAFSKHKGYGTKLHYERIAQYGISPVHRTSFLKKFQARQGNFSVSQGHFGEKIAYGYLCKHNYHVIARNYHSEYGEIDMIAIKGNLLCFVEVKLRSKSCPYAAKEAVTISKQRKIVQTAICFMQKHPSDFQPRFDVMEIYADGTEAYSVNFIENAFSPEAEYGFV